MRKKTSIRCKDKVQMRKKKSKRISPKDKDKGKIEKKFN